MPSSDRVLTVAFDASWCGPRARGMARHAAVMINSAAIRPIPLNGPGDPTGNKRLPQPAFEQFALHATARRVGADVCLSPYGTAPLRRARGLKQITVIHDLIFLDPVSEGTVRHSRRQVMGRMYRRWVVPRAAQHATAVITVSAMMKTALVERLHLEPSRIFLVPNSADAELYQPYTFHPGACPRILAVTGVAPHKNLARLLRSVARLMSRGHAVDVDIVGVTPVDGALLLRDLGLERYAEAITFQAGISRTELHRLYRSASCFVMPSLAEGFGIPLLEALAAGVPCVASDIGVFRDVGANDCIYFDPLREEDMVDCISRILSIGDECRCDVRRAPADSALRFAPTNVAHAVDRVWASAAEALG